MKFIPAKCIEMKNSWITLHAGLGLPEPLNLMFAIHKGRLCRLYADLARLDRIKPSRCLLRLA